MPPDVRTHDERDDQVLTSTIRLRNTVWKSNKQKDRVVSACPRMDCGSARHLAI